MKAAPVGRRRADAPAALSCDLWYTLVYFSPRERDAHRRRRTAAWTEPLVRGGLSRPDAIRWIDRLVRWGRASEARGRTPTLTEQGAWLAGRTRIPPAAFADVAEAVDRSLDQAVVRVAPGAAAALDVLRAEGFRLGIVSNLLFETADASRRVLERTGLRPRFEAVIFSDECGHSKPHPAPFRACLRALRVRPEAAAHIGDLGFDVVGAGRAGLLPILYSGLHALEEPAPVVRAGRYKAVPVGRWSQVPAIAERRRPGTPPRAPVRRSARASGRASGSTPSAARR